MTDAGGMVGFVNVLSVQFCFARDFRIPRGRKVVQVSHVWRTCRVALVILWADGRVGASGFQLCVTCHCRQSWLASFCAACKGSELFRIPQTSLVPLPKRVRLEIMACLETMLFWSLWTCSFSEFFNFPFSNLQRLPWLGFKVQNGKGQESWGCHHSSQLAPFSPACVLNTCLLNAWLQERHQGGAGAPSFLSFRCAGRWQLEVGSWVEVLEEQASGARCAVTVCVSLFPPIFTCLPPFEDRDHMLFFFVSFPGARHIINSLWYFLNE